MKYTIDIIAAVGVAMLSGMGVGGGGLLVIYLTLVRGVNQLSAQGINLVFFVFSATSALVYHTRHRKLNYRIIVICASIGLISAVVGHKIASIAGGELIRKIFGGFLIVCGVIALFSNNSKNKDKKP